MDARSLASCTEEGIRYDVVLDKVTTVQSKVDSSGKVTHVKFFLLGDNDFAFQESAEIMSIAWNAYCEQ